MAAAEHIRDRRRHTHQKHLERFKTDRERFLRLIDVLWEEIQPPSGVAPQSGTAGRLPGSCGEAAITRRNSRELAPRIQKPSPAVSGL